MGNKQSAKSIKGHHERLTESISKLMVGSMAQPVIAILRETGTVQLNAALNQE